MSLSNITNDGVMEDVDPGYIDEASMESLCAAIMVENLNTDEIEQFVTESPDYSIVTEKNIVKLDKNAKFSRAYKVGVLQCATAKIVEELIDQEIMNRKIIEEWNKIYEQFPEYVGI